MSAEVFISFIKDLLEFISIHPNPGAFLIVELGIGEHLMEVVPTGRDRTIGTIRNTSLDLTHGDWFGNETVW